MGKKTRKLGRGLSSMIGVEAPVRVPAASATQVVDRQEDRGESDRVAGLRYLDLSACEPNKYQPRTGVDDESLASLAASIKTAGVMQSIVVRPKLGSPDRFEIVAGERRWRAARLAGLSTVPAIVRELSDEQSAEWALIENLQREDLNPMEKAGAFAVLAERFGLSHAAVADRVGIERPTVTNLVRLLDLETEIQELIRIAVLQVGHGKALLSMRPGAARVKLAGRAARESWSVRRIEEEAKRAETAAAPLKKVERPAQIVDLEKQLGEHLGTKVKISTDRSGKKGRVTLEFYDLEHFDGLMAKMGFEAKG